MHLHKGVDNGIRLIAQLVARGVDARFDAWGPDNGELSNLKRLAARLGIANRVFFPGAIERSRLPEIASPASFYLQLSRLEGMAMAVVEGMQLGLVPVVTAVGQMSSYCRPGETGVIVDPDDLPAAAEHLKQILADPEHYASLRRGAMERWATAPLYSDDICLAAADLIQGGGASP
jgi:glycosyltransferase involved in cell wall biosynthesis